MKIDEPYETKQTFSLLDAGLKASRPLICVLVINDYQGGLTISWDVRIG